MIIWDKPTFNAYIFSSKSLYLSIDREISKQKCREFVAELSGYKSYGHLMSKLKEGPLFVPGYPTT